jgi:hypothetical protein
VLWDNQRQTIVNNESAEIVRMLNGPFGKFATNDIDLYPSDLSPQIEALNEPVYRKLNNGVYRAGFASTQQLRFLGFQPHAERHSACPATRAGHSHEDALSLLLVDVGALQHIAGLLFEQFVEREVAGADCVNIAGRGCGGIGFARRRPRRGR